MKHRREIDGLRALAVVPVILFHAGLRAFSGGYVGVDIFFVISGFLITSIIIREKSAETFSIIKFYERRARRILPALFVMCFACVLFSWFWLLPNEMKNFSQSLAAVSLFASNFFFYSKTGYFDAGVELNPLLHTWSLAVEEQFYFIFPLLLFLMWNFSRAKKTIVLSVLALIGLVIADKNMFSASFNFYLLPTRFWELVVGSLMAFYPDLNAKVSPQKRDLLGLLGLGMIGYAIFAFDHTTRYPSSHTLVPTIGSALLIYFATIDTRVGKFLGNRIFVGIGLISYSAYLWHQPVLAFARTRSLGEPSRAIMMVLVLCSFLLAYVSWYFVENPFRSSGRFSRRQIFSWAGIVSAAFCVVGLAGTMSEGFLSRFDTDSLQRLGELEIAKVDNGWCFYSVDSIPSLPIGQRGVDCVLGQRDAPKKALLFGDSFAGQYEPFWDDLGKVNSLSVRSVTTNWCYPILSDGFPGPKGGRAHQQCLFNRDFLAKHISDFDIVILSGMWLTQLRDKQLTETVELIRNQAAKSKLVIVMASPMSFDQDLAYCYKKSLLFRENFKDCSFISHKGDSETVLANETLERALAGIPNAIFIRRSSMFGEDPAIITDKQPPFSRDPFHISIVGAKRAAEIFKKSDQYVDLQKKFNAL